MLLVIGDLHAVIWGGRLIVREADSRSLFPNISIRYLGAPLGYNLIAETEAGFVPGKWGIEVLKHVRETPDVTAICLSFGEIDMRTRAVKVALDTGISARGLGRGHREPPGCVLRSPQKGIRAPDLRSGAGPHHPRRLLGFELSGLRIGERTKRGDTPVRGRLSAKSKETGSFHVVSVFDQLVDSTLRARTEFFADKIHLNTKGLDLLIAEFRRIVREHDLPLIDFWDPAGLLSDASA